MRIVGSVLMVIGLVMLFTAYRGVNAPIESWPLISGRYADETLIYLVVGTVTVVTGILVFVFAKDY